MITVLAVQPLLGQDQAPPAQGPEFGGSSPVGLVVTLLMVVALIFLVRSMNKHLRKVPPSFDPVEQDGPDGRAEAGPASTAGSGAVSTPAGDAGEKPSSGSPSGSTTGSTKGSTTNGAPPR
ncbi:MAG: hypothetical protein QOF99_3237 [Pseudonocardiales bacterium]|jgi:hypothetical protein|nr:hypothetical protein [Pseudonocardiales bacterium]